MTQELLQEAFQIPPVIKPEAAEPVAIPQKEAVASASGLRRSGRARTETVMTDYEGGTDASDGEARSLQSLSASCSVIDYVAIDLRSPDIDSHAHILVYLGPQSWR